ncbi:MAG: N-formylglutamate amidohydrolase [Pseudomonadota bacterium]
MLGVDDPAPARLYGNVESSNVLLVCEHASKRLPRALDDAYPLHLMETHFGSDIGAGALLQRLSELLDVPAIAANYSRIVIDCNRRLSDPTLILSHAEDEVVGANDALADEDVGARIEAIYAPFHATVEAALDAIRARGQLPVYIALHSFTPLFAGEQRPWDIGIMWDQDGRVAQPLMAALAAAGDITVGDNLPYSGREVQDFSVDFHAERKGYPCVAIEVRQDHLSTPEGIEHWSQRLAKALAPITRDRALQTPFASSSIHPDFSRELQYLNAINDERRL